jgi:hypothetical protein
LYVDENGKSVKRTPDEYPYSYNGYIVYRGGPNSKVRMTLWSDRLRQEDHKKYDELCQKHFGNTGHYFHNRNVEDTEAFLREFTNEPKLKIMYIMQCCNHTSGEPLWRFAVYYPKKRNKKGEV